MEAEKEKLDERPEVKSKLRIARDDILIQEYMKVKIEPSITVTEKEVDEKMTANPNLIPKESLTLKEILVKTEKEAKEIYEQLKKGGDFSRIAAEKSVAPSRVHGGLMRPVSRGQLPKPLEDVAYNLKKDELSQPIKTDQGYTLLYLVDRKERSPEEIKKYEAIIREKVKQIEMSQKAQAALAKKGDELKQKTKVEVFYDRLQ